MLSWTVYSRSYSYTCRLTYDTSHRWGVSFSAVLATPVADRLFYQSGLSVARHGKFVTDGALFSCQSPINLLLFAIRPVCALRYYAYLLTSHVSPKPKLKKAKISMEFRLSSLIVILSYRIYETKSIGAGIVHIWFIIKLWYTEKLQKCNILVLVTLCNRTFVA